MTDRRRNFAIIGVVLALLGAAFYAISTKETKLGLDLRGGVELVYEGKPTPKVPTVTPAAIEDATEVIRKRTDALGVSEPEIQRAGENQISVGLPDVQNAERAEEQVGTTAQLQFYDWEPNVFGETDFPLSLYEAVRRGAGLDRSFEREFEEKVAPRAEKDDRIAGADRTKDDKFYDRRNDTKESGTFYLFGPDKQLLAGPDGTCEELVRVFDERDPPAGGPKPVKLREGSECAATIQGLDGAKPPDGSEALVVPRGVILVKAERPARLPSSAKVERYFVLEDDSELSGDQLENPEQNFDPRSNEPVVSFQFTDSGKDAFGRVTKRIARRGSETIRPPGTAPREAFQTFAITLDDQIVSRATIDFQTNPEGIDGRTGAQIEGIGDIQETQDLAESLRIGALPIDLELISKTQVSATLGKQALDQGLLAGAAGLLLVLLFLIAFYRVLGLIAAAALISYAVFLFALVKLIPITLTLPGIAGLVLTLAVAADANIVIYERIKEEARHGRSIPAAIAVGFSKGFRTIVDANVVTFLVAFILFILATAGVKGFAFTLLVGTAVSLFTAVLAVSAILGSLARSRVLRSRYALGAGEERMRWRFDFMGAAKGFFSASGLILVTGALAIAGLGINFGIDFESGTRIKTPVQQPTNEDGIRGALPGDLQDAEVQRVEDPDLGRNVFQISAETLPPERVNEVERALDERFGVEAGELTSQSIGPTFGEQIANTALIAILASLVLISIYIGLRFEAKFAVPVLIALAHDLLITAGVYALFGREVTASTVAALLTILGFSLYDTIIVFDRIRENVPRMPRATFSQIVNRSMSEVLTRSLATSFVVLLPVASLMLFGGETLRDFAFALLVGTASGTYSSIFIAGPVLTLWKEREPVYRRRRERMLEELGEVPAFDTGEIGAEPPAPAVADGQRRRGRAAASATAARARARGEGAGPPPRAPVGDPAPTAGAEPSAPVPVEPPAAPDEGAPPPVAEPPRTTATGGSSVRMSTRGGDGDGDAAPPAGDDGNGSTAAAGASPPKPKRKPTSRRKHGRR